jgi:hypothetical protein
MPRVLVYEPIDPTGESLDWLAGHDLDLVMGPSMWQTPYQPFDDHDAGIAIGSSLPCKKSFTPTRIRSRESTSR